MTGEHDLLLRHFAAWAQKQKREPDLALMEELLHLRSAYDDLPATYWPATSIEHLLTERWPAKGPTETPEPAVVAETLEAYVRFLRNTGRMASGSAEPTTLVKEARRASRRMGELASDRANWSFNKQLQDFGRTQGISLEDAPDVETLQSRLAAITELWNALPLEERLALSPRPDDVVSKGDGLSEKEAAMERYGVDDPVIALLMTFADRLPTGHLPDEDVVAPYIAGSPYGQRMLELARWVGDGKEITSTAVLRPALAREAYAALGLGDWQLAQLQRSIPDERYAGVAAVGREAWIDKLMEQRWRSAGDCEELHRLWLGVVGSGLIRVSGKVAAFSGEGTPDAERWVEIGVRAAVAMAERARTYLVFALVFALMESYVGQYAPVSKRSMLDFMERWNWSPDQRRDWDEMDPGWQEEHYGPVIEEAAGMWADTGLYVEDAESITLTPFGDVFLTAWLDYLSA